MADNYSRQGQTFRSADKSGVQFPVLIVGAHVRTYTGIQSLTVTTTAGTLTVPAGTEFADIYCEGTTSTDFVRYWHSASTSPTASVGVKLKDHELVASANPANFKVILGTGSGTCILRVEYYYYA